KGALEIQLILERAAEESEMKSKRVGAAWGRKRSEAAERIVSRKLPGWVVYDEAAGRLALDPAKATTVRRIFELAREGHAVGSVIKARSTVGRGRRGSHTNLFAGLLVDARDGGTLTYGTWAASRRRWSPWGRSKVAALRGRRSRWPPSRRPSWTSWPRSS